MTGIFICGNYSGREGSGFRVQGFRREKQLLESDRRQTLVDFLNPEQLWNEVLRV
jgi:hypothetical protein